MTRRPTVTEARIKRTIRRLQRRATVAKRTAARTAHRAERHTVASHLRTLGLEPATATGIAGTLRKKVTHGVKGYAFKDGARRRCTRYTRNQVLTALVGYRPRKPAYKDARLLALAA